jgi:hypothetical protein
MAAEKFVKRMKSRKWITKLVAGELALPSFERVGVEDEHPLESVPGP